MKKIAVSIRNRVFSESVIMMLLQTSDFNPIRISSQNPEMIMTECQATNPEILLMDVTPAPPETTISGRLALINKLRQELPHCKMVMLCDEVAYPEIARDVMRAKQTEQIDAFFYASVTAEYLTAALDAL
ncbi:MAG: hypothetical protein ACI4HO_04485 [Ruminococcus sp.]